MRVYLMTLAIITVFFMTGCNDSSSTTAPQKEATATIVILMHDTVIDSFVVDNTNDGDVIPVYDGREQIGELEVEAYEYNLDDPPSETAYSFNIICRKNGYYACLRRTSQDGEIRIDYGTEFDMYDPETNCGVIFAVSHSDGHQLGALYGEELTLWSGGDSVGVITVDFGGRFETEIAPGDYDVSSRYYYWEITDDATIHLVTGYAEYTIPAYEVCVEKPNIYLYPEEPITLDVDIAFPHGGMVTVSEPQFPKQWQNIHVEPDGTIDGTYDYLFYECEVMAFSQKTDGWVVPRDDLQKFFTDNLRETGFIENEIDDFIEWWIPRLTDSEYYAIYPQYNEQLDPVIELKFSQQPDNIQRLIYCVESLDSPELELNEPKIPAFERTGFAVVEWGLIKASSVDKAIAAE